MAFPSGTWMQQIRAAWGYVADELESLYALLEGYLRVEHKEDGTHSSITADALTLVADTATGATGDATVGGDLAVTGTATTLAATTSLGQRTFTAGGTASTGPTLELENATARWALSGVNDAYDDGVGLVSVTDGQTAFVVYRVSGSTRFDICPPTGGTWTHHLGQRTSAIRWDEIAGTTVYASAGFEERSRTTPLGEWTAVAHSAGDFTGSASMTWTVASGDLTTLAYTLVGQTMTVSYKIITSTVGGTPDSFLQIAIPASATSARQMINACLIIDNGVPGPGYCVVEASGTTINVARSDGAVWSAATDTTSVQGQITFEIT